MLAREAEFTVIDFETTGSVDGYPNEPWQIGMVRFINGRVVPEDSFSSLLRVSEERPFNPYAPGRHACIRDQISLSPTIAELWPELTSWLLGYGLVAHNAGTERAVCSSAAPLHRFPVWVDTLKLVRLAYPSMENHSLEYVITALNLLNRLNILAPALSFHDALFDAFACGLLLEHLLSLPGWESVSIDAIS